MFINVEKNSDNNTMISLSDCTIVVSVNPATLAIVTKIHTHIGDGAMTIDTYVDCELIKREQALPGHSTVVVWEMPEEE